MRCTAAISAFLGRLRPREVGSTWVCICATRMQPRDYFGCIQMPLAEYVACLGLRPKAEIEAARRKLHHGIGPHSEPLVIAMWAKATGEGEGADKTVQGYSPERSWHDIPSVRTKPSRRSGASRQRLVYIYIYIYSFYY